MRTLPRTGQSLRQLLRDTRGAAMTEYAVVIGAVALVCAGSFIGLGVALVNHLDVDRTFLLSPFP